VSRETASGREQVSSEFCLTRISRWERASPLDFSKSGRYKHPCQASLFFRKISNIDRVTDRARNRCVVVRFTAIEASRFSRDVMDDEGILREDIGQVVLSAHKELDHWFRLRFRSDTYEGNDTGRLDVHGVQQAGVAGKFISRKTRFESRPHFCVSCNEYYIVTYFSIDILVRRTIYRAYRYLSVF